MKYLTGQIGICIGCLISGIIFGWKMGLITLVLLSMGYWFGLTQTNEFYKPEKKASTTCDSDESQETKGNIEAWKEREAEENERRRGNK